MKAVTCPVCEGSGYKERKIPDSHYVSLDCYGCQGTGWVAVREDSRPLKATADGCSEMLLTVDEVGRIRDMYAQHPLCLISKLVRYIDFLEEHPEAPPDTVTYL